MKALIVGLLLALPAFADDGGVPVACDGGLCDTTNGSGCAAAPGLPLILAGLAGAVARRRR